MTDAGVYVTLADLVALRHRARGFSFLPRQPVHSLLSGPHASRLRGRGLDFDEIRRYQPGDDPRQIDWKVTARTRKAHSRVFTEERERPVLLAVDQRVSMFFGSRRAVKSVVAAQAAALAVWRTVAVKDRVGAVVFGDRDATEVRPQRTQSTALRILQAVVDHNRALRADDGADDPRMLNVALRKVAQVATHDHLVVVISDLKGADTETGELLTRIADHNDILVVFVHDPLEATLPAAGRLVASDGGRQLEFDSGAVAAGYHGEFAARAATFKTFVLSREIPVLTLSTAEDVADQVARQLGAAARRHR
jgi:uncharacterized protein (DUF58 family)